MVKTARTNPAVFFATCARLIPNDVRVTVEQQLPGNLSMEDWQVTKEIIAAVRQAIPDASSKPPGASYRASGGAARCRMARHPISNPSQPVTRVTMRLGM